MFRRIVSGIMLTLLLVGMLTLLINVQRVMTKPAMEKILVFEEGFENGVSVWWNDIKGTPTLSTEIVHSGSHSYVIDEEYDGLGHWFESNIIGEKWEFEAWFYDNMSGLPTTSIIATGWAPSMVLGMLIWYGGDYDSFYAYRYGFELPPTLSTHPRSVGWQRVNIIHEPEKASVFLDGELLVQIDEPVSFNRFGVGDYWLYNTFSFTYYDDIKVWKYVPAPEPMAWTVDVKPDTLNLRTRGRWITAYIELPESHDVDDINVSSIMLNDTVSAEANLTAIGDYDSDGIPDLMVKFNRAEVIAYILSNVDVKGRFMTATLTITGYLYDGTPFQGSDTIRIILPRWVLLEN